MLDGIFFPTHIFTFRWRVFRFKAALCSGHSQTCARSSFCSSIAALLSHFVLPISLHHTIRGQCGSCGKGNRSLLPPEADGHSYCVVCSLLVSIQQMTTRIDSETDHRIVRLYQDLQAAAQRFWTTPHGMISQQSTTSTMDTQPGATTYSNPHTTVALAPTIAVDTPIYNVFVPGTEQQTRHFAQIGIPTYWQVTPRVATQVGRRISLLEFCAVVFWLLRSKGADPSRSPCDSSSLSDVC